jgi:hypothetical protein
MDASLPVGHPAFSALTAPGCMPSPYYKAFTGKKRKSDKTEPLAGEKSGRKKIMRPGDKNYGNNTSQTPCNLPVVSAIFSGEWSGQ